MSDEREKLTQNDELENEENDVEAHQLSGDDDREKLGGDRHKLGGDRHKLT
jgi:hypothetical protein